MQFMYVHYPCAIFTKIRNIRKEFEGDLEDRPVIRP